VHTSYEPSAFARWVADREPPGALLDVGSGSGRDSIFFAEAGFRVTGCDYAAPGLQNGRERARQRALNNVEFVELNLYDSRHVLVRGALVARDHGVNTVYSRAVVDAVNDEGRRNLLLLSRTALRGSKGRLYLEYYTERPHGVRGAAYWECVQPRALLAQIASFGFTIEHQEEVSTRADEPPVQSTACRIVARMT
jgi:SAM-dependent methyltransferase